MKHPMMLTSAAALLLSISLCSCGSGDGVESSTPQETSQPSVQNSTVTSQNSSNTSTNVQYDTTTSNTITTGTASLTKGAELYKKCAACHGAQGEKSALGKSRIIYTLSANSIKNFLLRYRAGTMDQYGMGGLMKGQVATYSDQDIKDVAAYIDTF
jgi:cytochrome c